MQGVALSPIGRCAWGVRREVAMIRAYHRSRGDLARNGKIIVPEAAHGTNPATATMCGLHRAGDPGQRGKATIELDALTGGRRPEYGRHHG